MLCGVTATLGSNPSATATAARPHWGRAVLLCLACMCGVLGAPLVFRAPEGPAVGPGCLVCPWAVARPRAVRAALGASSRSLARLRRRPPAPRPGPVTARGCRSLALRSLRCPPHRRCCVADVCLCVGSLSGQAPPLPINFARNSPAACSIIEFASLELQCFWGVSKNDHDKLRAKFGRRRCLVADMWLGASD